VEEEGRFLDKLAATGGAAAAHAAATNSSPLTAFLLLVDAVELIMRELNGTARVAEEEPSLELLCPRAGEGAEAEEFAPIVSWLDSRERGGTGDAVRVAARLGQRLLALLLATLLILRGVISGVNKWNMHLGVPHKILASCASPHNTRSSSLAGARGCGTGPIPIPFQRSMSSRTTRSSSSSSVSWLFKLFKQALITDGSSTRGISRLSRGKPE